MALYGTHYYCTLSLKKAHDAIPLREHLINRRIIVRLLKEKRHDSEVLHALRNVTIVTILQCITFRAALLLTVL